MATRFCDHGCYGAYAATPTWGVPQDGDGLAKAPSSTASTASIDLTSITSTAGTFGLFGSAQVSVGASASGATLASQIASAINASTTVVANATVFPNGPQIRDVFFAKAEGAVLSIMCRCGGEATNVLGLVWAGTWIAVPESLTFSGGVSGCFGYFVNDATIWPSASLTATKYGVFAQKGPHLGGMNAGDYVIVRSNKSISLVLSATNWGTTSLIKATPESPITIAIDDSTEWSDGAYPVFAVAATNIGDYGYLAVFDSVFINANRYQNGAYSLSFSFSAYRTMAFSPGGPGKRVAMRFKGVSFTKTTTISSGPVIGLTYSAGGAAGYDSSKEAFDFEDCYFHSNTASSCIDSSGTQYFNFEARFFSCVFSNSGNISANTGVFSQNTQDSETKYYLNSCKFVDFVSGSRLHIDSTDGRTGYTIAMNNCDFGNVSKRGPNPLLRSHKLRTFMSSSQYGNRDFHIENMHGFVEWNSTLSFPVCNAKLLDGVTGWSIHVIPTTIAGNNNQFVFVEIPRIGKINSLASGIRTLTIEMAIHESLSFNKSHISALVTYLDTDGNMKVLDTFDPLGAALTTSTATWSQEVAGQATFVDGSTQYHNKYKFSVTTPTAIATGTEIGIVIRCHTNVADVTKGFFIDPEILVA